MMHRSIPFLEAGSALAVSALLAACGGGSPSAPEAALQDQAAVVAVATPATLNTQATATLSSTGGNGAGAVTFQVTEGACTVSGVTLSAPAAAGTCKITATKAASGNYRAATSAPIVITVNAVPVGFSALVVVRPEDVGIDSYSAATAKTLPDQYETGGYTFGDGNADWWSGVGTDSVYRGVGIKAGSTGGIGVYVKKPSGSWSIAGATSITVGLGTNPTCVDKCKVTLILTSPTPMCKATINTPIKILTEAVNTGRGATNVNGAKPVYQTNLTEAAWKVEGCPTNTMAAFKALGIVEVHAQLLRNDMQTTTPANNSTDFANGLNLGAIRFD